MAIKPLAVVREGKIPSRKSDGAEASDKGFRTPSEGADDTDNHRSSRPAKAGSRLAGGSQDTRRSSADVSGRMDSAVLFRQKLPQQMRAQELLRAKKSL
eukprot:scaffold7324_cov25-Prasinocladus_malaysianus.AAC.1